MSRSPLVANCPRCGRRVLEVLADWAGEVLYGEPRLDPVSLDYQQVTACIVIGIPLWQIHDHAGRKVTSRRSRWWPRKPMAGHISPEHACGRVWDAFPLNLAPLETPIPDNPPF